MIRTTLAFSLAFALAAVSHAASISISSAPTVGLAGMTTYTLTGTAAAGEKVVGFDFVGGGGAYGITGPLNQVNPFSLPTVFNDNNTLFVPAGKDVSQDSQFLVKSTDGIAITPSESANALKGAFAFLPANLPAGNSLAFVQLVSDNPTAVHYNGTLTIRNQAGEDRLETFEGSLIPEPATLGLLGLALVGFCGIRRR